MDIDTLKAMLERRGYTHETVTSEWRKMAVGRVLFALDHRRWLSFDNDGVKGVKDMASVIDDELGSWQHHMRCSNCHEPLLEGGMVQPNERVEALLGVSVQEIAAMKKRASGFVYRSAKTGPDSPVLEHCPECQHRLDNDVVEEIDDEEDRKWDATSASPEGRAALERRAAQLKREIEAGEYEEGGFDGLPEGNQ